MPRARINGGIKGQISTTGGIRTASEVADLKTIGYWTGSNTVPIAGSSIISTVQYLTPAGANTAVTAVSAITGNTIAIYGQNFDAVNNVYLNNTLIPNTRVSSTVIEANVVPFIATSSTYVTAFTGVTADTVSLANSAPLSLAGTSWTVECWVNPTGNYLGYTSLFAKRDTAGTSYEGFLNITNGYVGFYNGTVYLSSTVLTANVWSHCAWVYNGSSVTIYVNGVAVSNTGAISITNYAVPLSIGSAFYNSIYQEFLYGSISNFRIVKGVAVYTGNFTVPAMPLSTSQSASTSISAVTAAQTSLLTLQSFTPADNSVNAATVTQIGNPTTTLYSLFGANTYNLSVFSAASGVGAIYYSGVQFQAPPVWSAYTVIAQPNGAVNYQLSATGATSYYLISGDISTMSLSTSGLITGTYSGSSAISFVVTAFNAYGLGTPQTVTVTSSYTTSYLIVGSGAGGSNGPTGGPNFLGAGGGAGGVLASTFQANAGVSYIVGLSTVPAGQSTSGGNSYITASPGITFGNLVAVGGGKANTPGQTNPAGMAAGAVTPTVAYGFPSPAALFYTPAGAQGYPGGASPGGGGGGAGGAGGATQSGIGGASYTWPINGVAYAGGGGGGGGGAGGGAGAGAAGGTGAGGSATNGTGSGGGGNSNTPGSQPGGSGGTGVVVIGYSNARGIQYATGGNLAVTNGYYLHTFTSPGTYTAVSTPTWKTGVALTTTINQNFAVDLIATDVSTVTYYLAGGNTLPAGTALSTVGVFSGNVASAGSYSFYVNATNQAGGITPRQFTLTVNSNGYTINYLAVGGGGAGGSAAPTYGASGGGGGGGGELTGQITVPSSTAVTAYTIMVGAGGSAQSLNYGQSGTYSNISAPTITTIAAQGGGGGGGSLGVINNFYFNFIAGQSGASGGGGGGGDQSGGGGRTGLATDSPGLNIAGTQGFPGGFGVGSPGNAGGGGGGAGGAGRSGYQPDQASGVGGSGLASSISGTLTYYASGGGGQYAPSGSGIGGNGYGYASSTAASAGATNTGSGGGGGSNQPTVPTSLVGGAGGSGIVVLRMPATSFSGNYTPVAGTTVANIGGTTILTFTTSGTYISGPNNNTYTAQYLIVAGGGAGGGTSPLTVEDGAAGGGGGGLLTGNTLLVAGTAYPITVGPGGAGGVTTVGTSGTPSTFNGITAIGGGGGGGVGSPGSTPGTGTPGGSGGGGGFVSSNYRAGEGIAGQGNPGGVNPSVPGRAGGGGGAGSRGSNGGPITGGPGGNGYTWPITGNTYAGGGGGGVTSNPGATPGSGGTGGGGTAGPAVTTNGTNGLGGGGGGASTGIPGSSVGGSGGSGVVVVAYTSPYQIASGGTVTPGPSNPTGYWLHTFTAPGTYTSTTTPTWVTSPTLTSQSRNTSFSITLSATDVSTVTYSLAAGNTLPANTSLNSSTGVLTGNVANIGTYTFYVDATNRRGTISSQQFSLSITLSYTISYLVVGGGGTGGWDRGGGGGGGGLLSGNTTVTTSYPVLINVGRGSVTVGEGDINTPGFSSNIASSAPGFTSANVTGGGRGGNMVISGPPSVAGLPGGSGGGGTGQPLALFPLGVGAAGTGVPGQGYPGGGSQTNPSTGRFGAGGGGGAGGPGGTGDSSTNTGGAGGAGYTWPFTGNTYAGGGGGAHNRDWPGVSGAGGAGGGGPSGTNPAVAPYYGDGIPGTPGTGGGGGGGSGPIPPAAVGGRGGPGTVILAMATPNYPGSAPGAVVSTPPAAPGYTVLTYTGFTANTIYTP